jgi:hypothetical protein
MLTDQQRSLYLENIPPFPTDYSRYSCLRAGVLNSRLKKYKILLFADHTTNQASVKHLTVIEMWRLAEKD